MSSTELATFDSRVRQNLIDNMMPKIFTGHYFSICDVRKIAEAMGIDSHSDKMKTLSFLHCMDFKDMNREVREELPSQVASALGLTVTRSSTVVERISRGS